MILKKVISGLGNFSLIGLEDKNILGVTDDSRTVGKDFLFCAIKGLHSDGHNFINEALKNGAMTLVVEKVIPNLPENICVIKVKDTRDALGTISSNFYGNPSKKIKVIGVTGTKGKTTTAYFIYQLLTSLGKRVSLVSSISAKVGKKDFDTGFHVTNPDTISLHSLLQKMLKARCEYAVLEVSSHGIHQKRIAGVSFDISVITNIASEHLDYHKTFKAYRDVKLSFLKIAPMVVLNADDPNFSYLTKKIGSKHKKTIYSLHKAVDFNIASVPLSKALQGDFNISNCLAAVSAVSLCGFDVKKINLAIPSLKLPEGRLEEIKNKKGFKIIVDFAHTPDSLESALKYLRADCKGKLIAVFGAAGERDPFKRPKMGKIASLIADTVILTAEDPRSEDVCDIMLQIKSGAATKDLPKFFEISDRSRAIKFALSKAEKGDTVGFFGKGHEKSMNLDGKAEIPWSDKEEIRKILLYEKH